MNRLKVANLVRANLRFFQMNRAAEKKFGVSFVQYHLLTTIMDQPGISSQSLAREVGTHPSTLTQSVRRLEQKEAIFVAPHPNDSRKKLISLTRKGLELVRRFEEGFYCGD